MDGKNILTPAWLTIKQVADYAGCGRTSIYAAVNTGHLEARKAFGRTLISKASIDALMASSPRIGRQSK